MVRADLHREVGHHANSSTIPSDWLYWLNLASKGSWGHVIPEYLVWRPSIQSFPKTDLENIKKLISYSFPHLLRHDTFPVQELWDVNFGEDETPLDNLLGSLQSHSGVGKMIGSLTEKKLPAILIILGEESESATSSYIKPLFQEILEKSNWHVSVITTDIIPRDEMAKAYRSYGVHTDICQALHEFEMYTPEIYCLNSFLRPESFPDFVKYMIRTRKPDIVVNSHSELGHLLFPWLWQSFPDILYVDVVLEQQSYGRMVYYADYAVHSKHYIDLLVAPSSNSIQWFKDQGIEGEKIFVFPELEQMFLCSKSEHLPSTKQIRDQYLLQKDDDLVLLLQDNISQGSFKFYEEIGKQLALLDRNIKLLIIGNSESFQMMESRLHFLKMMGEPNNLVLLDNRNQAMDADRLLALASMAFIPDGLQHMFSFLEMDIFSVLLRLLSLEIPVLSIQTQQSKEQSWLLSYPGIHRQITRPPSKDKLGQECAKAIHRSATNILKDKSQMVATKQEICANHKVDFEDAVCIAYVQKEVTPPEITLRDAIELSLHSSLEGFRSYSESEEDIWQTHTADFTMEQ